MSFHLISHKTWVGRMLFFPVSFPRLAEAPIPMWRFVELYCLWGQLIQQQTFGRAKKKHRAHPKKGTKKTEKTIGCIGQKTRGLWRVFPPKGGDPNGKPGGKRNFGHGGLGSCDLPSHLILCDLPRPRLSVQSQCHLWKRPRLKQLQTSKFEPNKVSFEPDKA